MPSSFPRGIAFLAIHRGDAQVVHVGVLIKRYPGHISAFAGCRGYHVPVEPGYRDGPIRVVHTSQQVDQDMNGVVLGPAVTA